jgi:hypothetical protein
MTKAQRKSLRRLIVRRALVGCSELPAQQRFELLLGAAEMLPRGEAEAARQAAFAIRESEALQTSFLKLLDS